MKDRLRELRKSYLSLTQKEFAEQIGLKRTSYSSIENGEARLTDRNINIICDIFKVNKDWLKYGTEPVFKKEVKEIDLLLESLKKQYKLDNTTLEIVKNFITIDDDNKKKILEIIFKNVEKYYLENPDKLNELRKKIKKIKQ